MEEYKATVWLVHSAEKYAGIASLDQKNIHILLTGTFYQNARVFHVNTLESTSEVKGLGRTVVARVLNILASRLDYPAFYLYSRPTLSFYLTAKKRPLHANDLKQYWTSVLEENGYETDALGHKEIRRGDHTRVLEKHRDINKCYALFEDDPLSRVRQHSPALSLSEIVSVLADSKDLTQGCLLLAKKRSSADPTCCAAAGTTEVDREMLFRILEGAESAKPLKYLEKCQSVSFSVMSHEIKRKELPKVVKLKTSAFIP